MNLRKLAICMFLIVLPACAPQQSSSVASSGNDGLNYTPTPPPNKALLEKVDMDGVIEESSNSLTGQNGISSIAFDKEKMELVLYLPMPGSVFFTIPPTGTPNHPDIIISTEVDAGELYVLKFAFLLNMF